jgi:hypothetical protein
MAFKTLAEFPQSMYSVCTHSWCTEIVLVVSFSNPLFETYLAVYSDSVLLKGGDGSAGFSRHRETDEVLQPKVLV